VGLHREVAAGQLPRELLTYLSAGPDLAALTTLAAEVDSALTAYRAGLNALLTSLEFDAEGRWGNGQTFGGRPFDEQAALFTLWTNRLDALSEMTALNESLAVCAR